jgi:hypothetical protein
MIFTIAYPERFRGFWGSDGATEYFYSIGYKYFFIMATGADPVFFKREFHAPVLYNFSILPSTLLNMGRQKGV